MPEDLTRGLESYSHKETLKIEGCFPPYLAAIFRGNLPEYNNCPPEIEIGGTEFVEILKNFSREADIKTVIAVKKANKPRGVSELFFKRKRLARVRGERNALWNVEFSQEMYDMDGQVWVGDIHTGKVLRSPSTIGLRPGEPKVSRKRVYIHSHSNEQTFSGQDFLQIFLGLDADRMLGTKIAVVFPKLKLMMAKTDTGFFLTFPTTDTQIPDMNTAIAEAIKTSGEERGGRNSGNAFYLGKTESSIRP